MKFLYLIISSILFTFCSSAIAQNYASPESVIYDLDGERYLISNVGLQMQDDGFILERTDGKLSMFAEGLKDPKGMAIYDGKLYVVDVQNLVVFNLSDGSLDRSETISGARFLNDVCSDGAGKLYMTDTQEDIIIAYDVQTRSAYDLQYDGLAEKPNGIIFENDNNRITFVSWSPYAPINSIDLETMTLFTRKETTLGYCDGIARDSNGDYYVSSWENLQQDHGKLVSYTKNFDGDYTLLQNDLDGPAGIFYNVYSDSLAVPNLMTGEVLFYGFEPVAPQAPKLIYPEDDSEGNETNLEFRWEASVNATRYDITVARDADLTDVVFSDETTETNYYFSGLPDESELYWAVEALKPGVDTVQSAVWSFKTGDPSIEAPVIYEPENKAENVSIRPTFSWTDVIAIYKLQIDVTEHFNSKSLIEVSNLTETSYAIETDLRYEARYFCRVQAHSGDMKSPWSELVEFTTESAPEAPNPPTLVSPDDNEVSVSTLPTFVWEAAQSADNYELQIADNDAFSDPIVEMIDGAETEFTLDEDLNENSSYYWKMRSMNAGGTGLWSVMRKFFTLDPSSVPNLEEIGASVYPIPASDKLFLSFSETTDSDPDIRLIDSYGNIMSLGIKNTGNLIEIDVSGLASGTYFLLISKDLEIYSQKIIVEK